MSGAGTFSARMSAFAWRAISAADAVKRGRVTLRLMLSQCPCPRNLAGLGAPDCTERRSQNHHSLIMGHCNKY